MKNYCLVLVFLNIALNATIAEKIAPCLGYYKRYHSPAHYFRHNTERQVLHEFFTELFQFDKVSTEYNAYQLLKERPLDKSINYLAIPWAHLINKKQLDRVPEIKLNGGFTICQHIHFMKIVPLLKKIGIDVLFTPHVSKTTKVDGITIVPFPHWAVNGIDPVAHKDVWYSFIGSQTHATRKQLFNIHHPDDAIIIRRNEWHFNVSADRREKEKREYQEVLARSRFSLCPRGTGPSTIRFWESLQAGAIPVLISDDTVLPSGVDWQSCIIQVAERDVYKIAEIVASISQEREKSMRVNCLSCFKLFSGQNFVSVIRTYYGC